MGRRSYDRGTGIVEWAAGSLRLKSEPPKKWISNNLDELVEDAEQKQLRASNVSVPKY